MTKDDFLAEERREHRDTEVDLLGLAALVVADLDATSCGRRFSADASFAMILMRDDESASRYSSAEP